MKIPDHGVGGGVVRMELNKQSVEPMSGLS